MEKRAFRFTDPDTGETVIAQYVEPARFAIMKQESGFCTKGRHKMVYVLCITQWGYDCQRDMVVARCEKCGVTVYYNIVTIDELKSGDETGRELEAAPAV